MAPTCPNSRQWVALLVAAGVCVVPAVLTLIAVRKERTDREVGGSRRWTAVAIVTALAVVIVNPPGHLNGPHADWLAAAPVMDR
jgi:hypothetical protein